VWIKPAGELPFLYGNHVVKAHLGRITEDVPEHQGVVVYNMADVPLVSGMTRIGIGMGARAAWRTDYVCGRRGRETHARQGVTERK
jgi:hypothetical protein